MKIYTVIISVWWTKYDINPAKYNMVVIANNRTNLHNQINFYLTRKADVYSWELQEIVKEQSLSAGVISLVFIPE